MHLIDWIVCFGILGLIVAYGLWKTRKIKTSDTYLAGNRDLPWYTIGLSVMATQASAITFLSTPGQAYDDGMRFAQFYFGLPIAMVLLCIFVLPLYYRLRVYTAYQFLEGRFDLRTRTTTSVLFLIQRGMAAGLTIYAPAIILSTVLGWNLKITCILIGVMVIIYAVTGGSEAVSQTQKQQMIIILGGMFVAFYILLQKLSPYLSFGEAIDVADHMGKMNIVDFDFDWKNKYNIWSGLLGGTFLFLSYFGTDQSQVQRYISGGSLREGRLGLLFNGIVKIPMQLFILLTGLLVFMFYQVHESPLHFNASNVAAIEASAEAPAYHDLEAQLSDVFTAKKEAILSQADPARINELLAEERGLRSAAREMMAEHKGSVSALEPDDTDYVFIHFIMTQLPIGIIGLLLAVIFSAAMSSTASELNALATTTTVDIYGRHWGGRAEGDVDLRVAKGFTLLWGVLAIIFAMLASLFENLIEAVNIVGSIFYGVILGIFVVAFFAKRVGGRAVFWAAVVAQIIVIALFKWSSLAFLWLNPIGCLLVLGLAWALQLLLPKSEPAGGLGQ